VQLQQHQQQHQQRTTARTDSAYAGGGSSSARSLLSSSAAAASHSTSGRGLTAAADNVVTLQQQQLQLADARRALEQVNAVRLMLEHEAVDLRSQLAALQGDRQAEAAASAQVVAAADAALTEARAQVAALQGEVAAAKADAVAALQGRSEAESHCGELEGRLASAEAQGEGYLRALLEQRSRLSEVTARTEALMLQQETRDAQHEMEVRALRERLGREAAAAAAAGSEAETRLAAQATAAAAAAAAAERAWQQRCAAAVAQARGEAEAAAAAALAAAQRDASAELEQVRGALDAALVQAQQAHEAAADALQVRLEAASRDGEALRSELAAAQAQLAASELRCRGEREAQARQIAELRADLTRERARADASAAVAEAARATAEESRARSSDGEAALRRAKTALMRAEAGVLAGERERASMRDALAEAARLAEARRQQVGGLERDLRAAHARNQRLNGICPRCGAALLPAVQTPAAGAAPHALGCEQEAELAASRRLPDDVAAAASGLAAAPAPSPSMAELSALLMLSQAQGRGASPGASAADVTTAADGTRRLRARSASALGSGLPQLSSSGAGALPIVSVATARRVAHFLRRAHRARVAGADEGFSAAAGRWETQLRGGRGAPSQPGSPAEGTGAAAELSGTARPPFRPTSPAGTAAGPGLGLSGSSSGRGSPAGTAAGQQQLLQQISQRRALASAATPLATRTAGSLIGSSTPCGADAAGAGELQRLRAALKASFVALAALRSERGASEGRCSEAEAACAALRAQLSSLQREARLLQRQRDVAFVAAEEMQREGALLWRRLLAVVKALALRLAEEGVDAEVEPDMLTLPQLLGTPVHALPGLAVVARLAARTRPEALLALHQRLAAGGGSSTAPSPRGDGEEAGVPGQAPFEAACTGIQQDAGHPAAYDAALELHQLQGGHGALYHSSAVTPDLREPLASARPYEGGAVDRFQTPAAAALAFDASGAPRAAAGVPAGHGLTHRPQLMSPSASPSAAASASHSVVRHGEDVGGRPEQEQQLQRARGRSPLGSALQRRVSVTDAVAGATAPLPRPHHHQHFTSRDFGEGSASREAADAIVAAAAATAAFLSGGHAADVRSSSHSPATGLSADDLHAYAGSSVIRSARNGSDASVAGGAAVGAAAPAVVFSTRRRDSSRGSAHHLPALENGEHPGASAEQQQEQRQEAAQDADKGGAQPHGTARDFVSTLTLTARSAGRRAESITPAAAALLRQETAGSADSAEVEAEGAERSGEDTARSSVRSQSVHEGADVLVAAGATAAAWEPTASEWSPADDDRQEAPAGTEYVGLLEEAALPTTEEIEAGDYGY
jgi:hypothetical protein